MVIDGEDQHGLQRSKKELEKFSLNFSRCASRDVAPLRTTHAVSTSYNLHLFMATAFVCLWVGYFSSFMDIPVYLKV